MFSLTAIVWFVVYVLCAGLVFGLLNYLIDYTSTQFPSMTPFAKFAKIGLMVLAILLVIGVILNFMGSPVVRMT